MGGLTRRGFLGSILALGAAPAIVRADSLMRIVPRETAIFTHVNYSASIVQYGDWSMEAEGGAAELADLITSTLRAHQSQLIENIHMSNALVQKMNKRCLWGG